MKNNNMKTFNVDGIKVSIPVNLFKEAVKVYVLEDGNTEEEKYGNTLYLENAVVASYTPTLDDLGKIDISEIKAKYQDEEISKKVQECIISDIKLNGGYYDIT